MHPRLQPDAKLPCSYRLQPTVAALEPESVSVPAALTVCCEMFTLDCRPADEVICKLLDCDWALLVVAFSTSLPVYVCVSFDCPVPVSLPTPTYRALPKAKQAPP